MSSGEQGGLSLEEWSAVTDAITPADAEHTEPDVILALAKALEGENETAFTFMVKGKRFDVDSPPTLDQQIVTASILAALTHEKPEPI